jgi:hypothetical protein
METTTDPRYPIGRYAPPEKIRKSQRTAWRREIRQLPRLLKAEVASLTDEQLDTVYREGGWTLRQVVHHLADSHMNAFIRFRLALTEDNPTIKPYKQDEWSKLDDSRSAAIAPSLLIIRGLHARWNVLLKSMKNEDWSRTFTHPETQRQQALDFTLGMYAWHGNHHLAHIRALKNRMNWK